MRILIISDHADPLAEIGSREAGGQNIYVFYLTRFLCKLGIAVDVYTRWDKKNKREVIKYNCNLRVIRVKAGPKRYMPRDNFLSVIDEFADNVLKRIEKEGINYDVVHTNYWFSGLIGLKISKKIKRPMVHVYHSIGQIRFDSLKKLKIQDSVSDFFGKRKIAEKKIAQRATRIIATSPVEKRIVNKLFEIPNQKIDVITIGVDTNVFNPIKKEKSRKFLRDDEKEKILLYVGRIEWRKGIGTLIYAFKNVTLKYPNSKLYIIGGGKGSAAKELEKVECEHLSKIAKELDVEDRVVFLGAKNQKILKKYYSAADVCIVPSYYEPFGIVPLESMACGTPVVASRTGGLQFSVKDGKTGSLAKPRDYNDLAQKINIVLKNGKNFYKDNCVERVAKHFNWIKISQQYEKYFNKLIEK
ncbi:MAG: Glycosyl transferase, group 1 [Candidatus Moranbacteria bacterium GW2011_GWF2_34_56]|nr:MAG: Glycosyl transferase, group 1 [Candidatus Moranbacteria bacterium GW2011_GWF1_34_10]KKP65203.1 MAG: Glycosyl transferase, group 1 [Candidatus Moranbacteria bacterium GW2011_GWF2_34_56]HBI17655.1 hypothetical protein [Candidatus Moranbacteria bacterium]